MEKGFEFGSQYQWMQSSTGSEGEGGENALEREGREADWETREGAMEGEGESEREWKGEESGWVLSEEEGMPGGEVGGTGTLESQPFE